MFLPKNQEKQLKILCLLLIFIIISVLPGVLTEKNVSRIKRREKSTRKRKECILKNPFNYKKEKNLTRIS